MNKFLACVAAAAFLALGGCGGRAAEETAEPIVPYREYFVALGPQGIFLLPTLQQKQAFDRMPAMDADAAQPPARLPADPNEPVRPTTQPWGTFVDRTGKRVFIAGDEELVERIRVAYEEREATVLLPETSADAPPVADAADLDDEEGENGP